MNSELEIFKLDAKSKFLLPYTDTIVPAGFPSPALDYMEQRLDLNGYLIEHPNSTFIIRVKGDSMINAGIKNDDLLIVDKSKNLTMGQTVIAELNGEYTVKRIERKKGKLYLIAANDNFDPIPIAKDSEFIVWGVVTYCIHKIC